MKLKSLLFFASALIICFPLYSIDSKQNDSIEVLLNSEFSKIEDKITYLNDLSNKLLEGHPRKSQEIAEKAINLASEAGDKSLLARSCKSLGTAYYKRLILDSAKIYYLKSIQIFTEVNNIKELAKLNTEMGNVEAEKGNYETSLDYYQKALKIFEATNDIYNTALAYSNIGALYTNLGDYGQMYKYASKALVLFRKTGDKPGIAACLTNIADYYFQKNDPANIYLSLTGAIQLFRETGATINESNALCSLADYYSIYTSDMDKALNCYNESLNLLAEGDHNSLRMDVYRNISLLYYRNRDYRKSLEYAQLAVKVTDTANIPFVQMNYYLLTYIYMALKDFPNGEYAFDKYVELTNQVYHERQVKSIAEMEVKYQTEKKEKEIIQLTASKKQRLFLIYSLLGLIALGSIIAFFVMRYIQQRRTIAEQKVNELIKTQQLIATRSVLNGEETERTRLAKDLHDGLGGLLSGVKHKLDGLKGDFLLDEEKTNDFNKAIDILDSSVKELRRVAHNLMPEALIKFGLKDALSDFCSGMGNKKTKLDFQFYGEQARIDQNIEIASYRITQELINNAMKHAEASKINIHLMQDTARLSITVQDDGKGFDFNAINTNKSVGLNSIQSRVKAFNGIIDINSSPGKGTEILIEFKL